jgi:hypothetical protein
MEMRNLILTANLFLCAGYQAGAAEPRQQMPTPSLSGKLAARVRTRLLRCRGMAPFRFINQRARLLAAFG